MIENKNILSQFTYRTYYRYDEAGNRINKKQYLYVIGTPPGSGTEPDGGGTGDSIFVDEGDGSGYWAMAVNIFYVRDAGGKEIAVYNSNNIDQWNIYGLDNVGKISSDNKRYFYLKDHLGSVRAMLDTTNAVVSANDYDCWGYLMENRSWQSNNTRYKFTGKEHDNENNYDYFGARYYDSRIGRWGGVEPMLENYISFNPYCYSICNPINFYDIDGRILGGDPFRPWAQQPYSEPGGGAEIAAMSAITTGAVIYGIWKHLSPNLKELYKPVEEILILTNPINGIFWTLHHQMTAENTGKTNVIDIPVDDKIASDQLNPPKERGLAPTSKETGKPIEIHHVDQNPGGPYKEMHRGPHREGGNYKKFHDSKKKSEINRKEWKNMVKRYWKKEWDKGRFNQ